MTTIAAALSMNTCTSMDAIQALKHARLLPHSYATVNNHKAIGDLSDLYDLLSALNEDKVSLLSLLESSAAFNTIDHSILLSRLS